MGEQNVTSVSLELGISSTIIVLCYYDNILIHLHHANRQNLESTPNVMLQAIQADNTPFSE